MVRNYATNYKTNIMINKNELRLGNFVLKSLEWHEPVYDIIQWDENNWYNIGECTEFFEWYEPIPITEEWLLKLGFSVRESSTCKQWYIGFNQITKDWLFDLTWLEKPELINAPNLPFYRNGRHTIFYVHQLQNLYYCLTGEELILK